MTNCVQCGVAIATDCESCVPKCTNCSNKCTTFFDTDCVWYNYNQPHKVSELTCLGIASNTSLTDILKAIDSRLCTPFQIQDTYTVDLEWTGANSNILTANVRIDPASTLPYSIGPNGIKLDCCDPTQVCDDVDYEIDYSLGDVLTTPSFYNVLDPKYFTASQQVLGIGVQDNTTMTGGTLTYLKYHNFLTGSIGFCSPLGSLFNLPASVCGSSLVGKSGQMIVELATTPYCRFFKSCVLETTKVPYSERYGKPVCFNPQFDEEPVFNGFLYFNDKDSGNFIRKWNFSTGETTTLSGNDNAGPWSTVSGSTGDIVLYDDLGSIVLDTNEVLNNEPCIYTVTKTGVVCRVFKAVNSNCDDRKNWVTHVIAGSNGSTSLVDGDGGSARFYAPNGVKRVGTYNNAPILLISDRLNNCMRILWFNGGNKNNASDWEVASVATDPDPVANTSSEGIGYFGSSYGNFNVDIGERKIFTFYEYNGETIIGVTELDAGMDMNDPADYLVNANLVTHYALKNTTAAGTSLTPSDGNSADASAIFFLSKIYHAVAAPNAFCYVYTEWDTFTPSIYLNGFYCDSLTPSGPSNYQFSQFVGNNAVNNGNIGAFASVANACSYGFVNLNLSSGNAIADYGLGGFRQYDFSGAEITAVLSGASAGTPNQTDIIGHFYDTQYEIVSTC